MNEDVFRQITKILEELGINIQEYSHYLSEPTIKAPILKTEKSPEETQKAIQSLFFEGSLEERLAFINQFQDNSTVKNTSANSSTETKLLDGLQFSSPIPPSSLSFPNSFFRERYSLIETLGEGGMGVVQRVQDSFLGREVALKKIKPKENNLLTKKQQLLLWRLEQEASITAILEHPNVIPLYDIQKTETGEIYFTMRKIEGETLTQIFKKKEENVVGSKDEGQLLSIFLKVCDAVSYAHSRGIIHRDLKPDNIMVGEFGEVYVMDWGIAKKLELYKEETQGDEGAIAPMEQKVFERHKEFQTIGGIGSKGYMPPEQEKDAYNVKPQADIFALGVILKECFTLKSPLEELRQQVDVMQNKTQDISKSKKNIHPDIQAIIQKATKQDWMERYVSVQHLANDVERYRKNIRVLARDYTKRELLWKWQERNQKAIILFILMLLILIISVSTSSYQEKLNQFQDLRNQAQTNYQQGALFEKQKEIEGQLRHLLQAFNSVNRALLLKPKMLSIEQEKLIIGKKLIQLACETEDYQLANYIATEMQSLTLLDWAEKKRLTQQIQKAKTKILKRHLSRFEYWKRKAKNEKIEIYERKDAIFEISKMTEKEIFTQLVSLMQEGTNYFIQTPKVKRTETQNKFYTIMVEALGHLENKKAADSIIHELKDMEKRLSSIRPGSRPVEELDYMIALSNALINTKALDKSVYLREVRQKMQHTDSYFWSQTDYAYQKLLLFEETTPIAKEKRLSDPNYYFQKARRKIDHGKDKEALQELNQVVKLAPTMSIAYLTRGNIQKRTKNYKEALKDFNKAIELAPKNIESLQARSLFWLETKQHEKALQDINRAIESAPLEGYLYFLKGEIKRGQKDLELAIQEYTKAIEKNPLFAQAYNERGCVRIEKNDYNKALLDFTNAIEINPVLLQPYLNRGKVNRLLGKLSEATKDFNKALDINPQSPKAYYGRAQARQNKDIEGAIADCTQAIKLNHPDLGKVYAQQGHFKIIKKEYQAAIKDSKKALRFKKKNSLAYQNLGQAYIALGKQETAIQNYEKALSIVSSPKIKESLSELLIDRALQKVQQKNFSSAFVDYNRIIELGSRDSTAYTNRGIIKWKYQKDLTGALNDFNLAIQKKPERVFAYLNRAMLREVLKDFQGALEDYDKILKLTPKDHRTYYRRGFHRKTYQQNFQGALDDYSQAIKLKPDEPVYYFHRAQLRNKQNDFQNAINDYTQAIKLNLPEIHKAYYNRAQIKERLKDLLGAIKDYNKAIQIEPDPYYYSSRAEAWTQQREFDKAIEDYLLAIKTKHPNPSAIYNHLGLSYFYKKKYKEAVPYIKKAITANPKNDKAYHNLAMTYETLGDINQAIENYQKRLALEHHLGAIHRLTNLYYQKGMLALKKEKLREALKEFEAVIALAPEDVDTYHKMTHIYQKLGELDQAITVAQKALILTQTLEAQQAMAELLLQRISKSYRQKKYKRVQEDLLLFKKYAPFNHTKHKDVEKMQQQIKKLIEENK